jgi:hypothetical protein
MDITGLVTAIIFFTIMSITIGLIYGKLTNWKRPPQ